MVISPHQLHQQQNIQQTVIRAPPQLTTVQKIAQAPANGPKPLQKQKLIMSPSSLQQYKHFNQNMVPIHVMGAQKAPTIKTIAHQSRKQAHPQQIIQQPQIMQPQIMQQMPQVIHHQHQVQVCFSNFWKKFQLNLK